MLLHLTSRARAITVTLLCAGSDLRFPVPEMFSSLFLRAHSENKNRFVWRFVGPWPDQSRKGSVHGEGPISFKSGPILGVVELVKVVADLEAGKSLREVEVKKQEGDVAREIWVCIV